MRSLILMACLSSCIFGVAAVTGAEAAPGDTADIASETLAHPTEVFVNDDLYYFATITNGGPATATNLEVVMELPDGYAPFYSYWSVYDGNGEFVAFGDCSLAGATATCNVPELPLGWAAYSSVSGTPAVAGILTATSRVSATETDPNLDDNSSAASATVFRRQVADLVLEQSASPADVKVHHLLTYTVTVTNAGPDPSPDVRLRDFAPFASQADLISVSSSQGTCTVAQHVADCSLGLLEPGATATVTVAVRPRTETVVYNCATVSPGDPSLVPDPDLSNNGFCQPASASYSGNAEPAYVYHLFHTNTRPLLQTIPNPCEPGNILLQLAWTDESRCVISPNRDRQHCTLTTIYSGFGYATSGTIYEITERVHHNIFDIQEAGQNYPTRRVDSVHDMFRLVAEGERDIQVHETIHMTRTPDGVPISTIDNIRTICGGGQ